MRRKVCYTFRRMVLHAIKWLNAFERRVYRKEWKEPEGLSSAEKDV